MLIVFIPQSIAVGIGVSPSIVYFNNIGDNQAFTIINPNNNEVKFEINDINKVFEFSATKGTILPKEKKTIKISLINNKKASTSHNATILINIMNNNAKGMELIPGVMLKAVINTGKNKPVKQYRIKEIINTEKENSLSFTNLNKKIKGPIISFSIVVIGLLLYLFLIVEI